MQMKADKRFEMQQSLYEDMFLIEISQINKLMELMSKLDDDELFSMKIFGKEYSKQISCGLYDPSGLINSMPNNIRKLARKNEICLNSIINGLPCEAWNLYKHFGSALCPGLDIEYLARQQIISEWV